MVTAADEVETAAECITVGADDFITKPFNKTLLRARVAASLEKKKLRDQEVIYPGQGSTAFPYLAFGYLDSIRIYETG